MDSKCVFFTRDEVVVHNSSDDMWVSVNGLVFDLTNLFAMRSETMNDVSSRELPGKFFQSLLQNLRYLLAFAGKDLSWAFDDQGKPLCRVNQNIERVPVFPPAFEKEDENAEVWWRDQSNIVGKMTCLERRVRIINSLTRKTVSMAVCEEDTISVIQQKYSQRFNVNAGKYIWRKTSSRDQSTGRLFADKTLTQNGIVFEKNEKLGLPPALWLFFVLNKD